ncbi:IS30 family transposase [Patescibacteria group bacterium]|nr:IS30 family transposase [Patescibacteria group bacterium]
MKNYSHITTSERELIYLYLNQGKGYRDMGRLLGRSDKTISREVERNGGRRAYKPSIADKSYAERRLYSKGKKLDDDFLKSFVVGKLNRGWSPEQIAGRIKLLSPDVSISHETIYQFIYSREAKEYRFWEFLRRGHARRQKKHDRKAQRYKRLRIPGRVNISMRPQDANSRENLGHWETDLMEGIKSCGVVSVLADRKSGYVLLDMLKNKEAYPKAYSVVSCLKYHPKRTITFDNGAENHKHELISALTGCKTFFCNPYHSWEKGTVENTIGLVRNYVPKGTNLESLSKADLKAIELELNNRPRKRLGYLTPYEVLCKGLRASPQL